MARHAAGYEELLGGGEVGDGFLGGLGSRPGPGWEFVDEVVAGEDKFFGGDLASCTEGGGVGDGGEAVAEGVEGGVDDIHDGGGRCGCNVVSLL